MHVETQHTTARHARLPVAFWRFGVGLLVENSSNMAQTIGFEPLRTGFELSRAVFEPLRAVFELFEPFRTLFELFVRSSYLFVRYSSSLRRSSYLVRVFEPFSRCSPQGNQLQW